MKPLSSYNPRKLIRHIKETPTVVRQHTETAVIISTAALCLAFLAFFIVSTRKGGDN